jgi:hypothetical protein
VGIGIQGKEALRRVAFGNSRFRTSAGFVGQRAFQDRDQVRPRFVAKQVFSVGPADCGATNRAREGGVWAAMPRTPHLRAAPDPQAQVSNLGQ